jgi:hypothetical protein
MVRMLMRNPNELGIIQDIFDFVLGVFVQQTPPTMKRLSLVPGIRQDGLLFALDQYGCVID